MSHFTVLVVGEKPEEQLQPFHEFECTGTNDQYVQEIDKTEEARDAYESETIRYLKSPDGQLHNYFDNEFYIKTKGGIPFKEGEHFTPEGYEDITVLYKMDHSFLDFIGYYYGDKEPVPYGQEPDRDGEHKYGYVLLDKDGNIDKYIKRTNCNKYRVEICGGVDETLSKMQNNESGDRVLLHIGEETKRTLEMEIRNFLGSVPAYAGRAKKIVCDLFEATNKEDFDRPQSPDREGARSPLSQLQYDFGTSTREFRCIQCGNTVPHKAHVIVNNLVGGSKWDWYQVGGRWTGYWALKEGGRGSLGKPGVFDNKPLHDADQARKSDIDFASMRFSASQAAAEEFDKFMKILDGRDFPIPWATVREKMFPGDINTARKFYNDQEIIKDIHKVDPFMIPWDDDLNHYYCDGNRQQFIDKRVRGCISTFAVLKDGEWHERGNMGWWGMVSDGKEKHVWEDEFGKMLDDLPDDTLLTVVDCHI